MLHEQMPYPPNMTAIDSQRDQLSYISRLRMEREYLQKRLDTVDRLVEFFEDDPTLAKVLEMMQEIGP